MCVCVYLFMCVHRCRNSFLRGPGSEAGHIADSALAGQPPRLAGRGLPRQARAQPAKMTVTDAPKDSDGFRKSSIVMISEIRGFISNIKYLIVLDNI